MRPKRYLSLYVLSLLLPVFGWAQEAQHISGDSLARLPIHAAIQRIEQVFGCTINFPPEDLGTRLVPNHLPKKLSLRDAMLWSLFNTDYTIHKWKKRQGRTVIVVRERKLSNREITGKLVTGGRGAFPIPGISLRPFKGKDAALTDENGFFRLKVFANDTVLITGGGIQSHMLYVDSSTFYYTVEIAITGNDITGPVITSRPSNERRGLRDPAMVKTQFAVEGVEINLEEIPGISSTGERDVIGVSEILPGVAFNSESLAERSFQGGGYDQNGVTLDGIPIIQPYHNLGAISIFSDKSIGQANILYQGFGAQHGRRIASNMSLTAHPVGDSLIENALGLGQTLLTTHFYLRRGIKNKRNEHLNGGIMASGRTSFANILTGTPLYNQLVDMRFQVTPVATRNQIDDTPLPNAPGVGFADAQFKVAIPWGERTLLSFTGLYAHDKINYQNQLAQGARTGRSIEHLRVQQIGSGVTIKRLWGNLDESTSYSQARLTQSRYRKEYDYLWDVQVMRDSLYQGNTLHETTFSSFHKLPIYSDFIHLEVGNEWTELAATQRSFFSRNGIAATPREGDSLSQQTWLFTHFAQVHLGTKLVQQTLGEDEFFMLFDVTLGLRHTLHQALGQQFWEPRLVAEAEVGKWQMRLAAGRYRQFVAQVFTNYALNVGEELLYIADEEEIFAPTADQLNLNLTYQVHPFVSLSAQGYAKQFSGISTFAFTRMGQLAEQDINDVDFWSGGTGQARGVDLILRVKDGIYQDTWVSYSLSKVSYAFDSLMSGQPFAAEQDQRHQFKFVHKFWITPRLTASAMWTFATGRPYTGVDAIDSVGGSLIFYGPVNGERLPNYHRLDMGIEYAFPLNAAQTRVTERNPVMARVGFSVFNLYNRTNISQRRYRLAEDAAGTPQLLALDYQLLGINPNVFFNLEF